ncbi:MAG: alpha/beta hydrolase [Desulfobacterales bacterium]|nr:alpha/beta hydrolase [Desulfobacterales bacterium]
MEQKEHGGLGFITGRWPLVKDQSTLVFIHGSGGSAQFWQVQVEDLVERANTIAVDLPGHGGSRGAGKDTIEGYAEAIIDFLDTLEAPGPIPCGLSLGGAITQQLLLDYAGRFRAGILIGTGAKLKVLPDIIETIENDFLGFVKMIPRFAASEKTDRAVIEKFQNELKDCRPDVISGDFKACNGFNVMARLGEINVPVLVVSADEDQLTPPKYADYLETAIRHSTRSHILAAGHIVPLEKPQAVNKAISDFLDDQAL